MKMQSSPPPHPWCVPILAAVLGLAPVVLADDPITITPEADSVVDTLVPFPYQGNSSHLWVAWNDTPGFDLQVARSYLRFPLAAAAEQGRIVAAQLTLTADLVLSGNTVFVHRSDHATWVENGINFGNQPGYNPLILASRSVHGVGPHSFDLGANQRWMPVTDVWAGTVTFAIRTVESGSGAFLANDARFYSRTGLQPPVLTLWTRLPGIRNGEFNEGTQGFNTAGQVAVIADPNDPGNQVAQLRTASASSLSQVVDLPHGWFLLVFQSQCLTLEGELRVEIDGEVVFRAPAAGHVEDELGYLGVVIDSRDLPSRLDATLRFVLEGPDGVGCERLLDNLVIRDVPEPDLAITAHGPGDPVTLSFPASVGPERSLYYQLETSPDLVGWSPDGPVIPGFGGLFQVDRQTAPEGAFFRVVGMIGPPYEPDFENYSFEEPPLDNNANTTAVDGWQSTGGAGSWNPPPAQYGGVAPDGENVGYVMNDNQLSHPVMDHLLGDQVYVIEVQVGRRTDIGLPDTTAPDVFLRVGGQKLTPWSSSSPPPAPGSFVMWRREYRIGPDDPRIGQPVELVLDGGHAVLQPSQVNFDLVDLLLEAPP